MVAATLSSCGPNYVFEEEVEIQESQWYYNDTLSFSFTMTDTSQLYDLFIELEHQKSYPFQNIYFQIYTSFPSGKKIQDRLSVDLMNKAGVWYGKCGKEECELLVNLQERLRFNETGTYQIQLEQFMRVDPLEGLNSLSLKLAHSMPKTEN